MTAAGAYLAALQERIAALAQREAAAIEGVARRVAASLREGGVLHVAGTGHSQLVALEAAQRAAGLAAVHPLTDAGLSPVEGARAAALERLPGYAGAVLETEDLRAGEVLLVVSNSGINAVPIELATGAAARGLHVVAITSRQHSRAAPSRHPDGVHLHDVAAVVIDTGTPAGDAALALADGTPVGPLSTLLSAAVCHAIAARAAELLVEAGERAPVLTSRNLAADDVNAGLFARYADRARSRP